VDGFGDRDLAAVASVAKVTLDSKAAFENAAARHPSISWLYTGPLENHPDLVERLSSDRPLLGNRAGVLRAVRDPFCVANLLRREGLAHAEVRRDEAGLPRDGSWLVKPVASGGGRLIRLLIAGQARLAEPLYYQRTIEGESGSALFVASGGKTRLIGASRQLQGGPAGQFAYRGNIGPLALSAPLQSRVARMGEALAAGFGLVGLFGVDFILAGGEPWLVEVNPRYTASVEVLELAQERPLLRDHINACLETAESASYRSPVGWLETQPAQACSAHLEPDARARRVVGKEVLYAEQDVETPEIPIPTFDESSPFAIPEVADVPWPGTTVRRGEPILTVLAEGPDELDCRQRLGERASRWRTLIQEHVHARSRPP
jgi:predicted ATP-grasp superfamily ATP-dependent carboligase